MNRNNDIVTDVVVIGAGLTGLSTAHFLNKSNLNFIVLEKADRVGGVIQTKSENGYVYECGPNTGVIGNPAVVELFDDLAQYCSLEVADERAKKRYILKNGRWEALPSGAVAAVRTPLFTLKDKFRILGEPFRPAGKNPHENLSAFVKRRLGKSFFDYAIDPFIIGVYAGDPNYLIPKYALPKLYNMEQKYGSLIGGTVRRGFDKSVVKDKRVTRKVFSANAGLNSLITAIYQSVGAGKFVLNAGAISVSPSENEYRVTYVDDSGVENCIRAKNVITTVGAYEIANVLPFIDQNSIDKIASLLYTKVIEVTLGFDKWEGCDLDGFGGLIPSVEERDVLGVLYMSTLFGGRAPEGGALLSIFMGGVRRQDLIAKTDDEIFKIIKRECKSLMGLHEFNPSLFVIQRHNKAIPQYGVESGIRFETIKTIETKFPGLQIGGNLRDGIGMADRIQQGKILAESILK